MHPVALFIKNKLKHHGRRDFFFNFDPLKNTRIEIHRVVNESFLFVRVAGRTVKKITENLIIEDWAPVKEHRFYFEQEGNIRKGTIFLSEKAGEWKRYPPSRVNRVDNALIDLKRLIRKSNRVRSY